MSTWYDAGRRIGLHTAIAQLTARKQQLFEIYNAAQIERICDIYDIKYHETEACLAIVQQILESKMDDTYQGPATTQPKKCPLPRIGSKDWGWGWDERQQMYTSPKTSISIQSSFGNTRIFRYYDVIIGLNGVPLRLGANLILRDAKILAEARARRDWRRENRGKR